MMVNAMKRDLTGAAMILVLGMFLGVLGQGNETSADRNLRGSGRVNPSTLAMEFELELGTYPGRGIDVPITVNYSSKVWRMQYAGEHPVPGDDLPCWSQYVPVYGEESVSGWTTSLAVPYIEYVGMNNRYNADGDTIHPGDECGLGGSSLAYHRYVKRILLHLPGGETHELRPNDETYEFEAGASPEEPSIPESWDEIYYAVDGSNIVYEQDSTKSIYRARLPDGSYYDFNAETVHPADRPATSYTDRTGNNQTTFDGVDTWTDTLGKPLVQPFSTATPAASPSPYEYAMRGMTGTYKFSWKHLDGGSAEESAVTEWGEPEYTLRPLGRDYDNCGGVYCTRSTYLFPTSFSESKVVTGSANFNPVVLKEIELPTGLKYVFTYDIYGRIETITYPTGGYEVFQYGTVLPLAYTEVGDLTRQANFGVVSRKLFEHYGATEFYEWTYSAGYVATQGYVATVTNPDGTKTERFLHRGNIAAGTGVGTFGFDDVLSGRAYEERHYDKEDVLVMRKRTHWAKTSFGVFRDWHPRVVQEETISYDSSGSGVSSTIAYEYDGNTGNRDNPLRISETIQFGYSTVSGGSSFDLVNPPCDPEDPECLPPHTPTGTPTPTPTSTPFSTPSSTPLKVVAVEYEDDGDYVDKNMVGLVTVMEVRNPTTIVSRSVTSYDDSGYSEGKMGNPTKLSVWDSSKGAYTSSGAYVSTRARFDEYGNQYESIDAMGNVTTTTFDSAFHAFPDQVTSPIPDPEPSNNYNSVAHGSSEAFVTTTEFDADTGMLLSTTDANGLRTEMEYDPATMRPRYKRTFYNSSQVGGTVETIYHDEIGNCWVKNKSQIDDTHHAEAKTYFDGLARAYKTIEEDSHGDIETVKEFDAVGRVKRVTNPYRVNPTGTPTETVYWTTNTYDDASRVVEVELPDGSAVLTTYGVSTSSPVGLKKTITDQAQRSRQGITDALGNMVRVIEDPSNQNLSTDYVFDVLGNLRKTTQGGQNRYFYHNSLGRLLRAKQPEQVVNTALALSAADPVTGNNDWTVKYTYDDNGNIATTTDANNNTITAIYDKLNRITRRDYSDSGTSDVEFYYDGTGLTSAPARSKGKLTKVQNTVSATRYTSFDPFGRLLAHRQTIDSVDYDTQYVYNLSGSLIEQTYPNGRVVKNTIDQDGNLSRVQSKKTSSAGYWEYAGSFSRDAAGHVTKMQLGNGLWETASFNERLQVSQIGLGSISTVQNRLKLEYSYDSTTTSKDNNGSLLKQTITVPAASPTPGFVAVQTYTYDDLNRLQAAEEKVSSVTTWKQTFEIDRFGNREIDASNTTTLGSCPTAVCDPDISDTTNRITTSGYTYDSNGNLLENAADERFAYDQENHQTKFFVATNSGSTPDATYYYDGDGRRVKKISSTEETTFVYDGFGKLIAEYAAEPPASHRVSYLTTDHLGSPRVITDQSGAVVSRKDFTAFGEESVTAERAGHPEYDPPEIRQNYTGYQKDTESGLEFAQARYYNPTHGRFTSADPLTASASIRNPQTFNRYTYVLNSPYKFIDPLGLLGHSNETGCDASYDACFDTNYWGPTTSEASNLRIVSDHLLWVGAHNAATYRARPRPAAPPPSQSELPTAAVNGPPTIAFVGANVVNSVPSDVPVKVGIGASYDNSPGIMEGGSTFDARIDLREAKGTDKEMFLRVDLEIIGEGSFLSAADKDGRNALKISSSKARNMTIGETGKSVSANDKRVPQAYAGGGQGISVYIPVAITNPALRGSIEVNIHATANYKAEYYSNGKYNLGSDKDQTVSKNFSVKIRY